MGRDKHDVQLTNRLLLCSQATLRKAIRLYEAFLSNLEATGRTYLARHGKTPRGFDWRLAKSRVAFYTALALMATGCSLVVPGKSTSPQRATPTSSATPTASSVAAASSTVSTDGFTVSDGTTNIRGTGGVAEPGTPVSIQPAPEPTLPQKATKVSFAAPPFDISLGSGAQPQTPVTASINLTAADAGRDGLAFITRDSVTGAWSGLPVARTDDVASVTMSHFSEGVWLWVDDVASDFNESLNHYLKLDFSKPSCVGNFLPIDGVTWTVNTESKMIYVCMELLHGKPTLTVRSNSPFVWIVRGANDRVERATPELPIDAAQIFTSMVYDGLVSENAQHEGLLVPGGVAQLAISGSTPLQLHADINAGLGLVAIVVAAIDLYAAMMGIDSNAQQLRSAGECAAGLIDLTGDPDAGAVTRTTLDCFSSTAEGPAAVVFALMTSLSSLLVTQVIGIAAEVTHESHAAIHIDATPTGSVNTDPPSVTFGGHNYQLMTQPVDGWAAAAATCKQKFKGYLAHINSAEENAFLYKYTTDNGAKSAYFGFSDSVKEGEWVWSDGGPSTYTNWSNGEPNAENPAEDYAMFYWKFTDGTWNDGDFSVARSTVGDTSDYLCERDS